MGRRGTGKDIENLILKLKREIPEIVLRTSLIVGFPETDEDFKILHDFVKRMESTDLAYLAIHRKKAPVGK